MPSEGKRVQRIRKALELSQQDFADFFGFARTYLSSIENDNDQLSRKQLSKLLLTYKVNINYVLEGKGMMFLEEEKPIERIAPENYAAFWLHNWGEVRLFGLQKYFGYTPEVMAEIMDIKVSRYLELITKNPFPKEKEANSIIDNFSGFTLDEILYDKNKTFLAKLEKKESDKIEIDLQSLPLEKRLKITALLKEI